MTGQGFPMRSLRKKWHCLTRYFRYRESLQFVVLYFADFDFCQNSRIARTFRSICFTIWFWEKKVWFLKCYLCRLAFHMPRMSKKTRKWPTTLHLHNNFVLDWQGSWYMKWNTRVSHWSCRYKIFEKC